MATNLLQQATANALPGPFFEEDDQRLTSCASFPVKLIAFYLPQFHPIPENDAWWGKGFTEWTNVTKALPRFAGHYQPRLPGEFGFYDLRQADVLRKQAELAQRYGVGGFCFHHYWFSGRRLLEKPLELLLANPDIDMPFCINWANESWSRRWDGHEKDILVQQQHSADDDIAFARSIEPYFRDPRYIRINGRPLLMLYRPSLLPDAAATVTRWRAHFTAAGLGDPFIVMAQAFGDGNAAKYGMDATVGFPPFWAGAPKRDGLDLLDPNYRGDVVDYEVMARRTVAGYAGDRRVFPGVCPSWDNEARKPGRGSCFTGSTPKAYGRWLDAACRASMRAFEPGERLVFINAWNEWAEGAYLEPDRHFGYAYLAETARTLHGLDEPSADGGRGPVPALVVTAPRMQPAIRRKVRRLARKVLNGAAEIADDIGWRLRNY